MPCEGIIAMLERLQEYPCRACGRTFTTAGRPEERCFYSSIRDVRALFPLENDRQGREEVKQAFDRCHGCSICLRLVAQPSCRSWVHTRFQAPCQCKTPSSADTSVPLYIPAMIAEVVLRSNWVLSVWCRQGGSPNCRWGRSSRTQPPPAPKNAQARELAAWLAAV